MDDISLTPPEYDLILRGHTWIISVDPYASLSRGWSGIMVDLLGVLDVVMEGVKFGWMRVHFALAGISGPTDAVWRLLRASIDRAEERSSRTCERCGAPGRLRNVDEWLALQWPALSPPYTLADLVSESRITQVIRVAAMRNDDEFGHVCGMMFGTRDPAAVAALHTSSSGLMGRLVHIARMQGLEPPYHVRPEEIVRLPALPAPDESA